MIRWRNFNYRSTRIASGMRTTTKIQIAAVILCGFLLGYVLIPSSVFSSGGGVTDSSDADVGSRGKFGVAGPLMRVREKAIEFSELGESFIVEGRNMRILSGAIHYFRVVPGYWEDRLRRLRASGLNTVETYVAWNMHEPLPNQYDFTGILDLGEFIKTAQRVGLHIIVRPGPYICAEWELGGLPAGLFELVDFPSCSSVRFLTLELEAIQGCPFIGVSFIGGSTIVVEHSWLLHDPKMELRSTYPPYLQAVKHYFNRLFEVLVPLQSAFGGPIIAFQIENEFAQYAGTSRESGKEYLRFLYQLMRDLGVVELLFTSDGQFSLDDSRALRPARDVLMTVNFQVEKGGLKKLLTMQPHKPLMVMEFWTGWFDHWSEPHLKRNILPTEIATTVESILQRGASINFYMFHGGTNFGFMNGGNWDNGDSSAYQPTITSYDYDAPISECGDITEKYKVIRKVISENVPESLSMYPLPPLPPDPPKEAYGDVRLTLYITLLSTVQYIPDPHVSHLPIAMEYLPVNGKWGQGYGFVLYRTLIPADAMKITVQGLKDYGVAMVDYKPVKKLAYFESETFLLPKSRSQQTLLDTHGHAQVVLDILVENAGRVNYGVPFESRKGILGGVQVDGREQTHWKMYSFEFKSAYVENIDSGGMWQRTPAASDVGPALFKGTLNINGQPKDTFIDMEGWGKGVVFINGANLGRYWSLGPQRTLYVPAPILRRGVNKVMIFEIEQPRNPQTLTFRNSPNLSTVPSSNDDYGRDL